MTQWWVYRCPQCSRSVSLIGRDQQARCGQCRRPLEPVGELPETFFEEATA